MVLLFPVEVVVVVWLCFGPKKLTWTSTAIRGTILTPLSGRLKETFNGGLQVSMVTRKPTESTSLSAFLLSYIVSSNSHGFA